MIPAFLSEKSGAKELDFYVLLWVCVLEFMARKRARLRVKCNLLFSSARSRKLQRRFAAGQKNLILKFHSELACWRLWHANAHSFAKNIICYFRLLVREYCWRSHRLREKQNTSFSLARPRKLQRRIAATLFRKKRGKKLFCRQASHSLHSCDTCRLFLFYEIEILT